MLNKKYMLVFIALLVACMSIVVAADVDDATLGSDVSDTVQVDSISTADTQQAVASASEDKISVEDNANLNEIETKNVNFLLEAERK